MKLHRHKWDSRENQFPIPDSPVAVDVLFEYCIKCGAVRYVCNLTLTNKFSHKAIFSYFKKHGKEVKD